MYLSYVWLLGGQYVRRCVCVRACMSCILCMNSIYKHIRMYIHTYVTFDVCMYTPIHTSSHVYIWI